MNTLLLAVLVYVVVWLVTPYVLLVLYKLTGSK